jgi:hypothetical protein
VVPEQQRLFAIDVVRRLRNAGFTAYLAGGCVRDQLLGRTPKDYDVATSATPPQIRQLFGHRRTLAIGAAFGVISVIGPKPAGMVEVATFRCDAAYSDGRHPDSVSFSSPEEDAARRDFTINGLFYDPIEQRVIDFVGGQEDLAARHIRAIGDARERFAEDKLRMLRAVRFAATFDFTLDDDARRVIQQMAGEIHVVSPERIAAEMQRMLVDPNRATAVRLLRETGLAYVLLPEIVPCNAEQEEQFTRGLEMLTRLAILSSPGSCNAMRPGPEPASSFGFALALAGLLHPWVDAVGADAICQRWRLSNRDTDRAVWLVANHAAFRNARTMRWSSLQPILIAGGIGDLLRLMEAMSPADAETAAYCREFLTQPRETLDPPPLLTGADLLALGIPSGPQYKVLLQRVRDAQLDRELCTKADALAAVKRWLAVDTPES